MSRLVPMCFLIVTVLLGTSASAGTLELTQRKLNVSGPEDLALRRQMQAKHADALGSL